MCPDGNIGPTHANLASVRACFSALPAAGSLFLSPFQFSCVCRTSCISTTLAARESGKCTFSWLIYIWMRGITKSICDMVHCNIIFYQLTLRHTLYLRGISRCFFFLLELPSVLFFFLRYNLFFSSVQKLREHLCLTPFWASAVLFRSAPSFAGFWTSPATSGNWQTLTVCENKSSCFQFLSSSNLETKLCVRILRLHKQWENNAFKSLSRPSGHPLWN